VTRLLAALVSFMVDEQLSSMAAGGKDDISSKVTQPKYNYSSLLYDAVGVSSKVTQPKHNCCTQQWSFA